MGTNILRIPSDPIITIPRELWTTVWRLLSDSQLPSCFVSLPILICYSSIWLNATNQGHKQNPCAVPLTSGYLPTALKPPNNQWEPKIPHMVGLKEHQSEAKFHWLIRAVNRTYCHSSNRDYVWPGVSQASNYFLVRGRCTRHYVASPLLFISSIPSTPSSTPFRFTSLRCPPLRVPYERAGAAKQRSKPQPSKPCVVGDESMHPFQSKLSRIAIERISLPADTAAKGHRRIHRHSRKRTAGLFYWSGSLASIGADVIIEQWTSCVFSGLTWYRFLYSLSSQLFNCPCFRLHFHWANLTFYLVYLHFIVIWLVTVGIVTLIAASIK